MKKFKILFSIYLSNKQIVIQIFYLLNSQKQNKYFDQKRIPSQICAKLKAKSESTEKSNENKSFDFESNFQEEFKLQPKSTPLAAILDIRLASEFRLHQEENNFDCNILNAIIQNQLKQNFDLLNNENKNKELVLDLECLVDGNDEVSTEFGQNETSQTNNTQEINSYYLED